MIESRVLFGETVDSAYNFPTVIALGFGLDVDEATGESQKAGTSGWPRRYKTLVSWEELQ